MPSGYLKLCLSVLLHDLTSLTISWYNYKRDLSVLEPNTFLHQETGENSTADWRNHDFTVHSWENSDILIFLWYSRVPSFISVVIWGVLFQCQPLCHPSNTVCWICLLNTRHTGFHQRPTTFHVFCVLLSDVWTDSWAPSLLLGITAVELLSAFFARVCF